MKGITLFSDIILLIIIVVEVVLIVGLIWVLQIVYGVESQIGLTKPFDNPRQISLNVLYKPVKYESILLTFLEIDCKTCAQKIPMKDILNAVAIQGKTDIWLNFETIDATKTSTELLDKMLETESYLLKIREPELIIAQTDDLPPQLQKVSTDLHLLNGRSVDLELYVG